MSRVRRESAYTPTRQESPNHMRRTEQMVKLLNSAGTLPAPSQRNVAGKCQTVPAVHTTPRTPTRSSPPTPCRPCRLMLFTPPITNAFYAKIWGKRGSSGVAEVSSGR